MNAHRHKGSEKQIVYDSGVPKDGKPDDTFYDCTGLDDGLYIGDCTHFYRCENETTRMLPCPGKLVVNEKQMWCD